MSERFFRRFCPALAASIFALTACQPMLAPVPVPTPQVITIQAGPVYQPLSGSMQGCANELVDTGLVLRSPQSGDTPPPNLILRWGAKEQPEGFTAVFGSEQIAVVVHPQNPADQLALSDLRAFYLGDRTGWPGDHATGEVHAMAYPPGDEIQTVFETAFLESRPVSRRSVYLVPEPEAVLESVSSDPNAVAFIPRRWLDNRVKEIIVEGVDPAQFSQPLLAQSESEPTGAEKAWLLCMQESIQR